MGWNVKEFHGNESTAQTMAMFPQSKVIVGYHGTGLANALFSPPGTIVLEFTTMRDIASNALWRSNAGLAKVHPNLTWIQHAVDVDRLDNGGEREHIIDRVRAARDQSHRDRIIKQVKQVHISAEVLFNAISRIKRILERLRIRSTQAGYVLRQICETMICKRVYVISVMIS